MRPLRNHRVRRNIAWLATARETCEESPARFSRTTLVLELYAADFSTEEKNSALIVFDEIFAPRRKAPAQEQQQEREEEK